MDITLVQVLAILVLIFVLGTGSAWLAGLFNPIGYIGVRPWNIPTCRHGFRVGDLGRCNHH